jgi:A/G-specific adenine glycosylase
MTSNEFKNKIWSFYAVNKRNFPWRETTEPYKILVSELMLQQTQTDRVVPKYQAFVQTFPNFTSLAQASQAHVLNMWQGLGYNRRALYLHQSAKQIHTKYAGVLPNTEEELIQLPGIGTYTARAVLTFAFKQTHVLIETNIRTVFLHFFFPDQTQVHDKEIMSLIKKTRDNNNPREWYYALMDYGAMLKKQHPNPNRKSRHYTKQARFVGSNRQLRGQVLKELLKTPQLSVHELAIVTNTKLSRLNQITLSLEKDGFVLRDRDTIQLVS